MASSKGRPSKAERQRRNRARREARQARSEHAGEATALSQELGGDGGQEQSQEEPKSRRRRSVSRPQPTGPTVPGQRAVLLSFLFSLVSIVLLIFLPVSVQREVPVDDPRVDEDAEIDEEEDTATIVEDIKLLEEESLPVALLVMLTPVAVTGAAVAATKHERRSTFWTMAMLGLAAYVFFIGGAYAIYSLPPLVALGVGGFQARRAESKERLAQLRAEREAEKAGGASSKKRGDVIDVDAVEDDDER